MNIIKNFLLKIIPKVEEFEYDTIWASRKVIKNQYLNPNANHYYDEDIWGTVKDELKSYLQKGITIYGEVAGYLKSGKEIQSGYDYGCKPVEHKIFVYRITYTNSEGRVFEFSAKQVQQWCKQNGLNAVPELWYGTAKDLYFILFDKYIGKKLNAPYFIEYNQRDFLDLLSKEYLEGKCHLCNKDVPAEGIVLRIEKLDFEAYKLKSFAFRERETKLLDKGIEDIEENQNESEGDNI
jgi:hypothetical protein